MHVWKGLKLSFNEDGSPQNENWVMTLNEREFDQQLKYIRVNGYCKVEIDNVFNVVADSNELQEVLNVEKDKYAKRLEVAFKGEVKKAEPSMEEVLKRLAALERENETLKDNKLNPNKVHPKENNFSMYNKTELIDRAPDFGLTFTDEMTKNDMVLAIKKAYEAQK